MSEYGSGLTMAQAAELDKERVRHALVGELMVGEDENGFVYEPATKEECDKYILEVVDNWYFEAKRLADSGRALEKLCRNHGFDPLTHLQEYTQLMMEAQDEYATYAYEHNLDALHDEARRVLEDREGA